MSPADERGGGADDSGGGPDAQLGTAGRIARAFINSKLTPLIVVTSVLLGLGAVLMLPREEEPQIVVPVIDLFVGLPGADPAEVESQVTIPLEKRMWELPGVEYVYSVSMPGLSMVTVRFYVGDYTDLLPDRVIQQGISSQPREAAHHGQPPQPLEPRQHGDPRSGDRIRGDG